jgi:hypothetical protein
MPLGGGRTWRRTPAALTWQAAAPGQLNKAGRGPAAGRAHPKLKAAPPAPSRRRRHGPTRGRRRRRSCHGSRASAAAGRRRPGGQDCGQRQQQHTALARAPRPPVTWAAKGAVVCCAGPRQGRRRSRTRGGWGGLCSASVAGNCQALARAELRAPAALARRRRTRGGGARPNLAARPGRGGKHRKINTVVNTPEEWRPGRRGRAVADRAMGNRGEG